MSNVFCTTAQFFALYDRRVFLEMSGDDNNRDGDVSRVQTILDMQASELESHLAGRWSLPVSPVPAVLTKWVAVTAADRLYARRNDKPSAVEKDAEWANKFIEDLRHGKLSLKGSERALQPTLVSSDFKDGRSRWDRILDALPSVDGPSKGI